jgi:D-alanine-D-alanine ligase
VLQALDESGIKAVGLVMDTTPAQAAAKAAALGADTVFNLVESVDGAARKAHLVPDAMRRAGLACTGSGSKALLSSTSKILCKAALAKAQIPCPPLFHPRANGSWIVKSVWEHASLGLDTDSVLDGTDKKNVRAALRTARSKYGGAWFAEAFIPGREFNLAMIQTNHGPKSLPPAEIVFKGKNGRHIVDWAAKWDESSAAFAATPRTFDFTAADRSLLKALGRMARACWQTLGLQGYARVDFRVHPEYGPMVIDVNANPCLSPDAGFAAALARADIAYAEAVADLVLCARRNHERFSQTPNLGRSPCSAFAASLTTC